MSHGNLSPRQKMINMMYLILTALLAMNVSAEILDAFVLVNDSLMKTEDGITGKNTEVYGRFDGLYEANKTKVGPFKEKADAIKVSSLEIVDYITELQKEILTGSGDDYELFLSNGTGAIKKKDDRENPIRIMLEETNESGKTNAILLKEKVDAYKLQVKEFLSGIKGSEKILESMENNLNTEDKAGQDGKVKSWEVKNFNQMPLVSTITLLTKLKTDILNVESDAINHLIQGVDAASYKFTNLNALVTSEKGYVTSGEMYTAKIFVGAQDTTQRPVIILDDGTRIDSFDTDGKGIFSAVKGFGIHTLSGKILVQRPGSSEIDSFPFKTEYQVAAPSVSVSATKMNVFYIGVDNPVDISAAGTPADQITASVAGGSISRSGSGYIVRVRRPGTTTVTVSANGKRLGSKQFRVKTVPSPVTTIGAPSASYYKGGRCPKATILALSGINATMENFEFDARYVVTSFDVSVNIGGFDETRPSRSRRFTPEQKNIIRQARNNSRVIIENVRAKGPDGTIRKINDLVLKI